MLPCTPLNSPAGALALYGRSAVPRVVRRTVTAHSTTRWLDAEGRDLCEVAAFPVGRLRPRPETNSAKRGQLSGVTVSMTPCRSSLVSL
jgi:hypothetical protein